jgi:hypothetical protein
MLEARPAQRDMGSPRLVRGDALRADARAAISRLRVSGFGIAVALCAGAYLGIQCLYIARLPLVMDEFDGAYDVYRLSRQVPYLDFQPYKTVLGYYVQLAPLLLAPDVWSGLLGTKLLLALINAASMAGAAVLAARMFRPSAVALALASWVFMSNWLERSSELRVDTLTGLAGLFSLLALLRGRPALAGGLAALSFLISQKGAYYCAASVAGLSLAAVFAADRRPVLAMLRRFGVVYAAMVVPYLVVFSAISSWGTTASSTFLAHREIAFGDIYPNIRKFWTQSLERNPFFYALACSGLVALGLRARRRLARGCEGGEARFDLTLLGYGVALGLGCIWHKQPWPYFFVLLVPTCFLLQAAAIEEVWQRLASGARTRRGRVGIGAALVAGLLLLSVAAPATRVITLSRYRNGQQRETVRIASALLRPHERYLAGVDLLYDRYQASSTLRRVSLATRRKLGRAGETEVDAILDELRRDRPKLLVHNERFRAFPKRVKRFLHAHYQPFWGDVHFYAPQIRAGKKSLEVWFAGTYRVSARGGAGIRVDGRKLLDGQTVELQAGPVSVAAKKHARLLLAAPAIEATLPRPSRTKKGLFADVYTR